MRIAGPSRSRRRRPASAISVVALTVLLAMVTYLDRVCISKLAPDIMRDLGLSKIQMGYVFSVVRAGLCHVRDSHRLVGRPRRHAARPHPHRDLVVDVHDRDRAPLSTTPRCCSCGFCSASGRPGRGRAWRGRFRAGFPAASAAPSRASSSPARTWPAGSRRSPWSRSSPISRGARCSSPSAWSGSSGRRAWYRWFRDDPTEHPSVNEAERLRIVAERPADCPHAAGRAYWGPLLRDRNVLALARDVLVEQHGLLLLHHVAADLPPRAARIRRRRRWGSCPVCRCWSACRAICSAAS